MILNVEARATRIQLDSPSWRGLPAVWRLAKRNRPGPFPEPACQCPFRVAIRNPLANRFDASWSSTQNFYASSFGKDRGYAVQGPRSMLVRFSTPVFPRPSRYAGLDGHNVHPTGRALKARPIDWRFAWRYASTGEACRGGWSLRETGFNSGGLIARTTWAYRFQFRHFTNHPVDNIGARIFSRF